MRTDLLNAIFKGYYKCSDQTLEAFSNLWFHTGDLAKIDKAENIYFLGRVKDVIRRRGENVNAFEVEEELLRHLDVVIAAGFAILSVFGDGTEDEIKVAVVVREESIKERDFDEQKLWEWPIKNMARFRIPSIIQFIPSIAKTPTGKVDKTNLSKEGGRRFEMIRSVAPS